MTSAPLLFHTGEFWVTFILFLPFYALLRRLKWQMALYVILFSLYFYFRSSGRFVLLLAATSLVDYAISHLMAGSKTKRVRRLWLLLSLATSVGVLAYFKYTNFFLWNWNQMVGSNFAPMDILLPAGVSFYTFQSISYVVDVYRGKITPAKSWGDYIFFLSFFPAILAGPIMRASYFLPQLKQKSYLSTGEEEIYGGLWLVILGIFKKAVIADYLAQFCNLVFDMPGSYTGLECVMGLVGYSMQIYFDFSGYSDMAIGLALIMGFRIGPNFNFPYKARSISDFWRRWHISLSSWLRDYVYIPLGGNRRGRARAYLNNLVTMLVTGLWHGAAWRFVLWGGMHGVGLVVHKAFKPLTSRLPDTWPIKAVSWLITFGYITALWILFRCENYEASRLMISQIIHHFDAGSLVSFLQNRGLWVAILVLAIGSQTLPTNLYNRLSQGFIRLPWVVKTLLLALTAILVMVMAHQEVVPFIYQQF